MTTLYRRGEQKSISTRGILRRMSHDDRKPYRVPLPSGENGNPRPACASETSEGTVLLLKCAERSEE